MKNIQRESLPAMSKTNGLAGKFKNIAVSLDTYLQLKTLGQAGDSFNRVIRNLIANQDKINQRQNVRRAVEFSRPPLPNTSVASGDVYSRDGQ